MTEPSAFKRDIRLDTRKIKGLHASGVCGMTLHAHVDVTQTPPSQLAALVRWSPRKHLTLFLIVLTLT